MKNVTVTRKEIAEKAGVSVSVVSRALNNSGYVEKTKKESIIKIAEELGYRPNPIAVSLMTQKTRQIIFYCREIRNSFNIEMYEGMVRAARERGYLVVVHGSLDFHSIPSTMADGIVFPNESVAAYYQDTTGKNYHLPAVSASYGNTLFYPKRIPLVECDCWTGMGTVLQYLHERGHERIALIMPYGMERYEVRSMAWKERMRYELDKEELSRFYLGISRSGLPGDDRVLRFPEELETDNLYIPEDFFGKGLLAAEVFEERRLDATAVICFNDEMALGFLKGYTKLGHRIPEELSVVGFDGSYVRRYANLLLTSLSLFPSGQGEKCVEVLTDLIDGKRIRHKCELRTKILEGETVRSLRR